MTSETIRQQYNPETCASSSCMKIFGIISRAIGRSARAGYCPVDIDVDGCGMRFCPPGRLHDNTAAVCNVFLPPWAAVRQHCCSLQCVFAPLGGCTTTLRGATHKRLAHPQPAHCVEASAATAAANAGGYSCEVFKRPFRPRNFPLGNLSTSCTSALARVRWEGDTPVP